MSPTARGNGAAAGLRSAASVAKGVGRRAGRTALSERTLDAFALLKRRRPSRRRRCLAPPMRSMMSQSSSVGEEEDGELAKLKKAGRSRRRSGRMEEEKRLGASRVQKMERVARSRGKTRRPLRIPRAKRFSWPRIAYASSRGRYSAFYLFSRLK